MKDKMKEILKQCKVLLVEDDLKIRSQIEEALYMYVDVVYLASNGQEALTIFYERNPHIIITDIKMPIMDGLSLTNVIRNQNTTIPIVVVSAYSEQNLLMGFMDKKLISYMNKPINFDDFSKVLENCAYSLEENGTIESSLNAEHIYSYSKKSILKGNTLIALTPKEITFLELLLKNRDKLVTKEIIEDVVWRDEQMSMAALNNLVAKLRKKTYSSIVINISTLGFMIVK